MRENGEPTLEPLGLFGSERLGCKVEDDHMTAIRPLQLFLWWHGSLAAVKYLLRAIEKR